VKKTPQEQNTQESGGFLQELMKQVQVASTIHRVPAASHPSNSHSPSVSHLPNERICIIVLQPSLV
jgi:hypothetical protein